VKAFDKIQHRTLIEMLEILDIDVKEIELIASLYWNQVCQDEEGTPDLLVNDEDCITIMLLLY